MTEFEAFRDVVARHVPGFPSGATASFDVTRHGVLDHVQRVLLRALVLDTWPYVAPGAVDAAEDLGGLWEIARSSSGGGGGMGPSGRSAADWRTNRIHLAPLDPRHFGPLYQAAVDPSMATGGGGGDVRRALKSSSRRCTRG